MDFKSPRLVGSLLIRTLFANCEVSGGSFRGARMLLARVLGGRLRDVDLSDVDLSLAEFRFCSLAGVDLSNARFERTLFQEVDLADCTGLERVVHVEPSGFDLRTLVLTSHTCGGKFSAGLRRFFSRAGVPAEVLDEVPRIIARGDRTFLRVFLSHAEADREVAELLTRDFERAGVPCWTFAGRARGGRESWQEIGEAIGQGDKVVVLCSRASLHSPGVVREIERALRKEDSLIRRAAKSPALDTEVLIPITLDDYLLHGWRDARQPDVARLTALDFRDWRSRRRYRASFEKLLDSLVKRTGGRSRGG